jgi:hypothetical protein
MREIMVSFAFLACVALLGCGSSDGVSRGNVSGTVTVDGTPVADGSITFTPTAGTSGPNTGGIIKDGKYSLTGTMGPVVGKNEVRFSATKMTGKKVPDASTPGQMRDEVIDLIPANYKEVKEVAPGNNTFDFTIKK